MADDVAEPDANATRLRSGTAHLWLALSTDRSNRWSYVNVPYNKAIFCGDIHANIGLKKRPYIW